MVEPIAAFRGVSRSPLNATQKRLKGCASLVVGRSGQGTCEFDQGRAECGGCDRHEFSEFLELLKEPRWPEELESFTALRDEIAAELRVADAARYCRRLAGLLELADPAMS
jgi:hypothetical protein